MASPSILLVANNPQFRRLVTELLRRELFLLIKAFVYCTDAMLAIEANDLPSAIVFDVSMPDGNDGNDLLRWRNQRFPQVPAIAMPVVLSSLKEPGATAVLTKPFHPKLLVETLKEVLGKAPVLSRT